MQTHDRDAGLRRLNRLTALTALGAGALVAGFATLAARAFPGRHVVQVPVRAPARKPVPTPRRVSPPPLVSVESAAAPAGPAPPAAPPTPGAAPPVVVSGGT